ncbi:MAG: response regulator transcription factor [Coriobacteriia bacterium]|nr:response regulator transcription factor [Coriobacteriia bacterium]
MNGSSTEKAARILVIDDEVQILRALRSILTARRYDVETAETGEAGIGAAAEHRPDLIVLDLTLPGKSGLEVCRELRSWLAVPILVLSVRDSDDDKIAALDLGADDYLTKPFSAGELLARIRALLRRVAAGDASPREVTTGGLTVDFARRMVVVDGCEVRLTRTEFDILALLAHSVDRVVTSRMLLERVWGPEYVDDTQTLRVHISHLRHKIEPEGGVPRYVLTEPGVGFRLVAS